MVETNNAHLTLYNQSVTDLFLNLTQSKLIFSNKRKLDFIPSKMNQIKNSILFKNIKMEIENLMEKLPMLQIEYEMYESGVYLEFKSWAEDLQSRAQHLLRLVSKRKIGALLFIILFN